MLNRSELVAVILCVVICGLAYHGTAGDREKQALSILLVPWPASSHMMGWGNVGEELVRRGHNVTFCVAQTKSEFVTFGRQISSRTGMAFLPTLSGSEVSSYKVKKLPFNLDLEKMLKLEDLLVFRWEFSTISKQIVETLDSECMRQWDIVLGEDLLWPLVVTLTKKWSVPVIHLSNILDFQPSNLPLWSYPLFATGYTDDLTFLQRFYLALLFPIQKVVISYLETLLLSSGGLKDERSHIRPGVMSPYIVTTSFGFEYPRPLLLLYHYVGPMEGCETIYTGWENLVKFDVYNSACRSA